MSGPSGERGDGAAVRPVRRGERVCCRWAAGDGAELAAAAEDQRRDWVQECHEVNEAFTAWCRAPMPERIRLYADYLLALEREQQASELYARLLREARRAQAGELRPLPRTDRVSRWGNWDPAKHPPGSREPGVGR